MISASQYATVGGTSVESGPSSLIFALPLDGPRLSFNLSGALEFSFVEVDQAGQSITQSWSEPIPGDSPQEVVKWLRRHRVSLVIAANIPSRWYMLMKVGGIGCIVGAPVERPEELVQMHLSGELVSAQDLSAASQSSPPAHDVPDHDVPDHECIGECDSHGTR